MASQKQQYFGQDRYAPGTEVSVVYGPDPRVGQKGVVAWSFADGGDMVHRVRFADGGEGDYLADDLVAILRRPNQTAAKPPYVDTDY